MPTSEKTGSSLLKIESRNKLWYGKYIYRARFSLVGINRSYRCTTFLSFLKKLEENLSDKPNAPWASEWQRRLQNEVKEIDLDAIEQYINWRTAHTGQGKPALIRSEMNTAAVFSNDLLLLQSLQNIHPDIIIIYTRVENNIPQGHKYYAKEPPHKFRVYLRSMNLKAHSTFRLDLTEFIERYQKTNTIIVPSRALRQWLWGAVGSWRIMYCQEHFYLDYDEPSTYTLISLLFGDMLSAMYKLEKRPQ